jgi:four helix bundle protein
MSAVDYRGLEAWQCAMSLAEAVYRASAGLPPDERYGLIAQMRRAAISIPANIAEGQGRRTCGEFLNQLSVAHGSLRELETHALMAERLKLLDAGTASALMERAGEVGRLIQGLARSLERRR